MRFAVDEIADLWGAFCLTKTANARECAFLFLIYCFSVFCIFKNAGQMFGGIFFNR